MKNECSIIRDILPLYVENMVSEDTSEFVKEHLESCPACRAELEKLREPVEVQTEPQPDMDAAPLKRLKKALLMKKVQTILCTAAVLLALMLSVISFLTAPEYFAYSPELVTVTEEANGAVTLSFSNEVTNYKLQQIADPEDRNTVYHLEVWTSAWDRAFHRPGVQAVIAAPESGKPLLVYFTQFINGHAGQRQRHPLRRKKPVLFLPRCGSSAAAQAVLPVSELRAGGHRYRGSQHETRHPVR